jgi:uridine phosphorylase
MSTRRSHLAIVNSRFRRYGTCGGLRDTKAGTVVVSEGTILVRRDGDLIAAQLELQEAKEAAEGAKGAGQMPTADDAADIFPYLVSNIVRPDAVLTSLVRRNALPYSLCSRRRTQLYPFAV